MCKECADDHVDSPRRMGVPGPPSCPWCRRRFARDELVKLHLDEPDCNCASAGSGQASAAEGSSRLQPTAQNVPPPGPLEVDPQMHDLMSRVCEDRGLAVNLSSDLEDVKENLVLNALDFNRAAEMIPLRANGWPGVLRVCTHFSERRSKSDEHHRHYVWN